MKLVSIIVTLKVEGVGGWGRVGEGGGKSSKYTICKSRGLSSPDFTHKIVRSFCVELLKSQVINMQFYEGNPR